MGAFTGGSSSNSFFGASGASNFLTKTTRWFAVLFAVSCFWLSIYNSQSSKSVMDSYTPSASAPQAPAAPGSPGSGGALPAGLSDPEIREITAAKQKLDQKLAQVHANSLSVELELQDLYELLIDQKAFLGALPTRKPAIGYFTSGFGIRRAPFGGEVKMHEGLDIANFPGTTIFAPASGRVTFAGLRPGYGRTVILDHGYGLETWYGHTQKTLVNKGDRVTRGAKIAQIGNSGQSTGPHVHYEVRVHGIPVDPLSYILED
jgi:murein DD-endopeptidase MepM/ murein hydrolase activator NlpD